MMTVLPPTPKGYYTKAEWEAFKDSVNRKRPHLFAKSMKKLHDATSKMFDNIFKDA